ncbi:MAG: hypothetical protein CMF42_03935 [Legionellales bacterium]|nr:hypothetical protein [Legionellales bacterium]OUX67494.1 MAG: hypothetical protein CBD38_02315 [bacterium TMED178]
MYSIRQFLLINLLIGVTIIIGFSIMANIANEHGDFSLQLDAQLAMSAYTIESFLNEKSDQSTLQQIQDKINDIELFKQEAGVTDNNILNSFLRSVHFQIWNKSNKLILKSYHFPKFEAAPYHLGFDQVVHNGKSWRTLTIKTKSGFIVRVMQLNSFRMMVERQLTNDSIVILLIMYPALGVLIWIIVGRGLQPVNRIAKSVKRRKSTQLKPIKIEPLPDEVKPLIDALNGLFEHLNDTLMREKLFASNAAHELKTPIAALKARVQLTKKQKDHHLKENIEKILEISDRCEHIIQQLLYLSRTMPESAKSIPELVPMNQVCDQILDELKSEIKEKSIKVVKKYDKDPYIKAQPTHIHMMFRNIIDNAIRYSFPKGTIHIRIVTESNRQIIRISDKGQGLSDKDKEKVFERFYRVLGTQETGSGLGLSIVHQIAKIYKANISLENNQQGPGLTVEVTFFDEI